MSGENEYMAILTGGAVVKAHSHSQAETMIKGYDGIDAWAKHVGIRWSLTSLRRVDAEPEPTKIWVVTAAEVDKDSIYMATCSSSEAAKRYVEALTRDKVMWTRQDTAVTGRFTWHAKVRVSTGETLMCHIEEDVLWT